MNSENFKNFNNINQTMQQIAWFGNKLLSIQYEKFLGII